MMNRGSSRLLPLVFIFFIFSGTCFGQRQGSDPLAPVLNANSLASGNTKDILTSFFQLAFDNLTGPKKSINFNSNPFAIMLKENPGLAVDSNYYKYRRLRKLNFNFGLNLDTSFKMDGFTLGFKYALINRRDTTTSPVLLDGLQKDSLNQDIQALELKILNFQNDSLPTTGVDPARKDSNILLRRLLKANLNKMRSDSPYIPFANLDPYFKKTVTRIALYNGLQFFLRFIQSNPAMSIQKSLDENFTALKKTIKYAPLWTVSLTDTATKNQLLFSNITLATQYSKGVFKLRTGSNLELDIRASVKFSEDSSQKSRNLQRDILIVEPGINWVVRNKSNDHSQLEFKLGGSYIHNFNRLYTDEKRDQLMFSGIFRVRLINDIWIPLEFKYDPSNGNVFGFLSVKANFTGLGKLLNGMPR